MERDSYAQLDDSLRRVSHRLGLTDTFEDSSTVGNGEELALLAARLGEVIRRVEPVVSAAELSAARLLGAVEQDLSQKALAANKRHPDGATVVAFPVTRRVRGSA